MPETKVIMDIGDNNGENCKCSPRDLNLLVRELRTQVKEMETPGNIVPRTDSKFLAKFIRTKDYSVPKALTQIQKYYNIIDANQDFIEGVKPSDFPSAFNSECFTILKHRFNGVGVAVGRIKHWKPKVISLRDFQLAFIMLAEQYTNQPNIQENGISVIVDFDGLRFEHVWKASIKEIKRTATAALQGLPVRVKEIHVLNTPSIFWPVYHVGKVFVKEKIHKRVHFHADLASLHAFFDREMLPISLGGSLSETEAAELDVVENILKENIPYEEYWNGAIPQKLQKRLSKRSSHDG